MTVQAEGNAPLNRAYTQMQADGKSAHQVSCAAVRFLEISPIPWGKLPLYRLNLF